MSAHQVRLEQLRSSSVVQPGDFYAKATTSKVGKRKPIVSILFFGKRVRSLPKQFVYFRPKIISRPQGESIYKRAAHNTSRDSRRPGFSPVVEVNGRHKGVLCK
jgi:hypothetical protein